MMKMAKNRFDDMREGEPARKLKGKKRSFKDNMSSLQTEQVNSLPPTQSIYIHVCAMPQDVMKAQIRIVKDKVDKKAKGVNNSLNQYDGILPDAPDGFRQKKGKGRSKSSTSISAGASSKGKKTNKTGKKLGKRLK